ncbi:hypothetical protein GDO86_019397 [Hymenochirus boettgeri]|uniref:Disintegrin and metalloproteinase domain-containing protein 15-like n=1 Tax=Hymenochirus boettgeri TaxID=247094 RepID=A0A8T2IGG9_9PIPI|nr:hypothetical protein GDO86_019397 [Hymenochirus boettgeri]
MATMGSMCTADRSGGVNMDHSVSILAVASTVAHELGHNLGLSHDTDRKCGQPRKGKKWIMEPSAGFLPGLEFSNCSLGDLEFSLRQGWANCLFNVPSPKSVFGTPQCGNLLVEDGEQCDCGLAQDCTDPCCDASTCQLHPGAQCSSDGQCCEGCKLRASGSLCRQPVGECDLPEYCNGVSPHCPPNVFLQNGETCDGGQAYCYQGKCHTLQQQCQDLWGPGSSSAPEPCFTKVNIRGDKYGNCGRAANGSYLSCSKSDVWCGKLQCQGGSARSRLGASAQIVVVSVTVNGSELACRGTHFNTEDDIWDSALLVTTGTPCGAGKVCVAQRCVDVSALRVGRCSNKCNGNGVCNSNNNCHCHPGWAPPDCVSSGQGGSVDSGSIAVKRDHSSLTAAILVICLVVVPLCSLLGFCYTRRDSLQRRFNKFGGSNKCQYRVTQSSSQPRPQRPPPPNWEQSTELQVMSSSYKAPGKPPPPKKPLPTDPVSQTPLLSVPTYPSNMMAPPTRLAPPPPHSERTLQL